jgi:hypothetical protein
MRAGASSKSFWQADLTQDGIRRVTARYSNRHGKVSLGNWAAPDFMAAFALADHEATRTAQEIAQRFVKLRSHSGRGWFGLAQRRNLQKQICRIDVWVIVGQQIECHR